MGESGHFVAVIGGAVAGAEAAATLAEKGFEVVVFDQNALPYGKIEDGLPRWHERQRIQEFERIDRKLTHPHIHFVPRTRIGRDLSFRELSETWGFSAIVLANGAWRDRPLEIPGIEAFEYRGLVYQNPLLYWFNHYQEPDHAGPRIEIADGAIVIGGGLASLDVVKILQLELTARKLEERGIWENVHEIEKRGIPETLRAHGLTFEGLGLQGCTLYYRRRMHDMPIVPARPDATPKEREKTAAVREKLLRKAMAKFCFRYEPCALPVDKIVEGDRLVGLSFVRTEIRDGGVVPLPETRFSVRAPLVVGSIGSIPEPIEGIEMDGEFYRFEDRQRGILDAERYIFAVGNVVTGKGNILLSRKHSTAIAEEVVAAYVGVEGRDRLDPFTVFSSLEARGHEEAETIARCILPRRPLSAQRRAKLLARVRKRQETVGYDGRYETWVEKIRLAS